MIFGFKKYLVIKLENIYLPNNFLIFFKMGPINSILCKTISLATFLEMIKGFTKNC